MSTIRCWCFCLLVFLFLMGGCKKFITVDPPRSVLSTKSIFSTDANATAFLLGVYHESMTMAGYLLNAGCTVYAGMSSDELRPTGTIAANNDFYNCTLAADNANIVAIYRSGYGTIYGANMILENVAPSTEISAPAKRRLCGEAYFLRALIYGYLRDLFGEVPLDTTTNTDANATMKRGAIDAINRLILLDLERADSLIDTAYTVSSDNLSERVRPNKWAARALLARAYLYQGNWRAAADAASAVIEAGNYQLESLDKVFVANSREAIWQLQPVNTDMNTAEGYWFVPSDGATRVNYVLMPGLLADCEQGDQRLMQWTKSLVANGVTDVYPYKYHINKSTDPIKEENTVLRLAEQYLIRAEARARLGLLNGAIDDLDVIRLRAGLSVMSGNMSQDSILRAVEHEERIEFFAEWGHRWFDLKRLGQADSILSMIKPKWQTTDLLYPIPALEVARNPNIVQNPGYN